MSRSIDGIVSAIDAFEPQDGCWLELDELLQELFQSECPTSGVDALLRVFERFPTEDGAEVFWGIVHGLENLPDYEKNLVESVSSSPSEFGLIMVHRLLNSGVDNVSGVQLLLLIEEIAKNDSICDNVRSMAVKFLARHKV
ncbi:MAG: hypothetical protein U0929_08070 [Planctomycetaceae bacterium]